MWLGAWLGAVPRSPSVVVSFSSAGAQPLPALLLHAKGRARPARSPSLASPYALATFTQTWNHQSSRWLAQTFRECHLPQVPPRISQQPSLQPGRRGIPVDGIG